MKPEEQLKLISRGIVEIIGEEDLLRKLYEDRSLTVKFGIDPTAPDIHLGHTVPLQKLRQFQSLGHQVQLVVGDYTAMIGDPSGRSETRPMLTREEIEANLNTYKSQVFKVLDEDKTRLYYNSVWLNDLTSQQMIQLASKYTVQQMLQRRDFGNRMRENRPITISEIFYPLLVGYDSVVLQSDIEIGGTDQLFNFMTSREVQQAYGIKPEAVVTLPLLEGLDGKKKMSKSLGNAVGIEDAPFDMFGKIMSISDELMMRYYVLISDATNEEIEHMKSRMAEGENPIIYKQRLAREIVGRYHGETASEASERRFNEAYRERRNPMDIEKLEIKYTVCGDLALRSIISEYFGVSRSQATRLIEQGAVDINGEKVKNSQYRMTPDDGISLRVGKKEPVKLYFKKY